MVGSIEDLLKWTRLVRMETNLFRPEGVARPPSALLVVRGEDSFDFLQSQGTADLRPCLQGQIRYGLWLDHKGLIHADGRIWRAGNGDWWILSEYIGAEVLREKFERHIIADDVELIDRTSGWELLSLDALPASFAPKDKASPQSLDAGWYLGSSQVWSGGVDVLLPTPATEVIPILSRSPAMVDLARLQAGVPLVGRDIELGRWNPFEAGLMGAVSLQKGCFLGQEVVARAHRLGRRSTRFVTAVSEQTPDLPEAPCPLLVDGQQVGEWTSLARSEGTVWALGWLKTRFPDGSVDFDSGGRWAVQTIDLG
jgi:folate-binding protein YgfZ